MEGLHNHLDLRDLSIRNELQPMEIKNNLFFLQHTTHSKWEEGILQVFEINKGLDDYSSNISHCVQLNERKIHELKLYDYHVLMQQLLPLVVHGVLCKNVCGVIIVLKCVINKSLTPTWEWYHCHTL